MHTRTAALALLAAASLALTGCTHSRAVKPISMPAHSSRTASADWATIHAAIPTTRLTATVTATSDSNHLLGRPHQYTSAVKFADSRINTTDVEGLDPDDVQRGGAIEVFANHGDAQARARYIQAVTKSLPALTEYDYVHGVVLVRVSHYLTPSQAAGYGRASAGLR